ncbi:MAG TPA: AAA-like domain-containing protein [Thermoanaerobaculia bacterium]|nr:AAA-like domain-containing protein [Thermoanaerobaculia bacterium]
MINVKRDATPRSTPARPATILHAKLRETVSQVFLSYRHVPRDEQLAEGLCAFLQERGLRVFLDKQIGIGLVWAAEIDRQLRASDSFVVLLSENSIRSDMVRQEIQAAHELRQEGKMAIFPVRLGFQGKLPYDLGGYLNHLQYALWNPGDSETELFARLHTAITGGASLPVAPASEDTAVLSLVDPPVAAERKGAPFPAADPRIVMETGTIRLDSPFYVRRREDGAAESCLGQPGSTIVVKGPRQSGKSSLLARIHALSKKAERRSVYVDFQTFDEPQLASLGTVLQTLAGKIARSLKTTLQPKELWDSELLGEKGSFSEFLVRAVLNGSSSPVVLILDEVDRLFDRSYRGDLFAAVRGWHNNRATEEAWENLHLVLGHATDPALWIENLNESPFNVGDRLRLGDFTRDEVADLNDRHGKPLRNAEEITGLMELVGGHPYLVRQALYVLATERWSLARLRDEAGKDTGPFGDHLRRHLWALLQSERLRAVVARIAKGEGCDDEGLFQHLLASGLAAGEDRFKARLRCALYQQYFLLHL